MPKQIVALSKKLISIKSDPENTKELQKALDLVLDQLSDFTIERFERNGVVSALIHNQKKKKVRKFTVLLNGHLDVIPGKEHQYSPVIKGKKLYGVGSMDMKSNVACLVMAFKEAAANVDYPLGLQIVTDEEIGGFDGTKLQVDKGVRADFVIAGETTNFDIVNQAKGVLWAKVSCKGVTGHGAYPWKGENALWAMHEFLKKLEKKFPVPRTQKWASTVNVSKIETTNQTFNKIPDDCTTWLDIRFIPKDEKKIVERITALLPKGFTLEIIAKEPALFVDPSNEYVRKIQAATKKVTRKKSKLYGAQGTSDARHFTKVGCNGIEFGPIGGGIATDKEWVDIPSLETYQKILVEFLYSL